MALTQEFFYNKRILVTGDTGFKGRWLVRALQTLNVEVCGISLYPPYDRNLIKLNKYKFLQDYEKIQMNILDVDKIDKIFERFKPEYVFHLAAQSIFNLGLQNPIETIQANVIGSVNIAKAALQHDSVIGLSIATSDKVYEKQSSGISFDESSTLGGTDPYSASKVCTDLLSRTLAEHLNFREKPVSTIRAGNVIGGGDWGKDRLIPDIYEASELNKKLIIRNPGSTRPFQSILDVIQGYLLIAQSHLSGSQDKVFETYNIGPTISLSVEQVLELASLQGLNPKLIVQGQDSFETRRLQINSDKIKNLLGWNPLFTASEAVQDSLEWYQRFGFSTEISSFSISSYLDKIISNRNLIK